MYLHKPNFRALFKMHFEIDYLGWFLKEYEEPFSFLKKCIYTWFQIVNSMKHYNYIYKTPCFNLLKRNGRCLRWNFDNNFKLFIVDWKHNEALRYYWYSFKHVVIIFIIDYISGKRIIKKPWKRFIVMAGKLQMQHCEVSQSILTFIEILNG